MSGSTVMLGQLPWWIRVQVKAITWLGWRPKGWPSRKAELHFKCAMDSGDPAAITAAAARLKASQR